MFTFDDFEQSGTFLVQKSWFFSSSSELPRISARSRSEHENSCFSQSTSYISIFSEHFAIFLGSPSRIFREITVLDTVLSSSTGWFAQKGVHFSRFGLIRTIFVSKITIFQFRHRIASCCWPKPFRSWKSLFFVNYLVYFDFSWYFWIWD